MNRALFQSVMLRLLGKRYGNTSIHWILKLMAIPLFVELDSYEQAIDLVINFGCNTIKLLGYSVVRGQDCSDLSTSSLMLGLVVYGCG